jgi:septal ring factor EnvC (AmiA/AmiB activator)
MKSKIAVVILLLICVALGVALVAQQRKHSDLTKQKEEELAAQTTTLQNTSKRLEEQTQVNMELERDLLTRSNQLASLSNNLGKVIADLEKSDAQAKATAEQLRAAQADLAKKDQKINELEGERAELGKQMDTLTGSIQNLEQQIAATEKKLATAQGEKDFLTKELMRLRAEKAELERQFNDLAVLRAQVGKLKEELAIARRLEFIRLNLFGGTSKGGAERLMSHMNKPPQPATNYGLDVEIRQDGGARVVSPTNAPAPAPKPAVTNAAAAVKLPQDAPAAPAK